MHNPAETAAQSDTPDSAPGQPICGHVVQLQTPGSPAPDIHKCTPTVPRRQCNRPFYGQLLQQLTCQTLVTYLSLGILPGSVDQVNREDFHAQAPLNSIDHNVQPLAVPD